VRSAQRPSVLADVSWAEAPVPDIALVPGGIGARRLVEDERFLAWLQGWAGAAEPVGSVCTGSGVLAAAGLLDG
jgi:putative intracellular protease/amidase